MKIPGYLIKRKIDQGGMSTVYLAVQLSVGREVALKVMSPVLNADPVFSERFQREANIVGQLSHPSIVSIYDIGRYNSLNYIAMDYLPGGTVYDRMSSGMSVPEIVRVIKEIARGLDVARAKGYVHRDIKPENILFREDGTAVLTDFGVAKAITAASGVTNAGTVVGTPHYMSPEQSRGQVLDSRSDLYSLGVVFYEMLTGVVPYQADEAIAIAIKHMTDPVPRLPGHLAIYQPVLDRFLAKQAADRFQSGADIVAALEQVENTALGTRHNGTAYTDPSDMNVTALLRALVITSFAVIKLRLGQLFSAVFGQLLTLRWTPKRGFYRRPRVRVTEIRTELDTLEQERDTVISTRVRKAASVQSDGRFSWFTRALTSLLMVSVIWSAISVGMVKLEATASGVLPEPVEAAITSTAHTIQFYSSRIVGERWGESRGETRGKKPEDGNTSDARSPQNTAEDGTLHDATLVAAEEKPVPSPKKYRISVDPQPQDARIRIMNIREKYHRGIQLEEGRYLVAVSRPGYRKSEQWVKLEGKNLSLNVILPPLYSYGDTLSDPLEQGGKGPKMIVIPKGWFTMGKQGEGESSPAHRVDIKKNIAVSQYEISFADYRKFAEATGTPLPDDHNWGRANRPVINVSWQDANNYANWLNQQTGKRYRLPTEAEWEYVARASTKSDYWWGDKSAKGKANCKRGCDSDYAGMFRGKTAPVGSYDANPFGLFDVAGNVAEWTQDCYEKHYLGAPTDGSARTAPDCEERVVRDGSAKDSYRDLYHYQRRGFEPNTRDETIGFRLVREMVDI